MEQERPEQRDDRLQPGTEPMSPGDEVPPGTPGAGQNTCRDCGGTGRRGDGDCPTCGGSGLVTEPVGGA